MQTDEGLETFVHFYSDQRHLFTTVTMSSGPVRDRVLDRIVSNHSWYWGRFSITERARYMLQRETVERLMRAEFEKEYWKLPSPNPVYFYVYPRLDLRRLLAEVKQRSQFDERRTRVLTVSLKDLPDIKSLSFTFEDSFQSYKRILRDMGLPVRNDKPESLCTECRETVFHIGELEAVYAKHQEEQGIYFEVQMWDPIVVDIARTSCTRRK